jgi:pilus assembly protein CpaF
MNSSWPTGDRNSAWGPGGSQPPGGFRPGDSGEHPLGRPLPQRAPRNQAFFDLQRRVQTRLAAELESRKIDLTSLQPGQAQHIVEEQLQSIIPAEARALNLPLSVADRESLMERCRSEIIGYGPIEPLLRDPTITEIMVNNADDVWVEQNGKMFKTSVRFQDNDHVVRILQRIVAEINRRIDETSPMVDARLRDGSRVNAIIPPLALDGPKITIRKFPERPLQPADLIRSGSITAEMMQFLEACVRGRLNVIVSGGTNSGKTTLLNVLSVFIPNSQRIITIEDSAELQLQQDHVVRLESRPASVEGKNQVTIRQLVANALRMNPTRIIVGECRGGEALDMLQAMNTGHDGSMTTVHANSARDVLTRLEMLVLQAAELPTRAIREQVANAVHLIVHTAHLEDGSRRVQSISEIRRGSGEGVEVVDIFEFERTGVTADGKVAGRLRATGQRPRMLDALERQGLTLPPAIFNR